MIVFFQIMHPAMVVDAIECARMWNDEVVLIADHPYSNKCQFVDVRETQSLWPKFDKLYKHQSSNPSDFEKACLKRWLSMLDFCNKRKVNKIFHADSDVLLFSNPLQEAHSKDVDVMLSTDRSVMISCGGQSVQTVKSLDIFADHIMEFFSTDMWINWGANDMSAWTTCIKFKSKLHSLKVGESNRVLDNVVFDHNLEITDDWIPSKKGGKLIAFDQGQPYCFTKAGQPVRMANLHCWARHKKRIPDLIEAAKRSRWEG